MSGFSESTTIQAAIVHRLSRPDIGWEPKHPDQLNREDISALIEPDVIAALVRLNPCLAEKPERVQEILPKLRAVVLSVLDDGLIQTNERMMNWLRGLEPHQFIGTPQPVPVRLIDFEDPRNNTLVVSAEVWFQAGTENRRFDIVLWVNGLPVVVGETKTPVDKRKSWLNGARDIHDVYEIRRRRRSSRPTCCRSRPRAGNSTTGRSATRRALADGHDGRCGTSRADSRARSAELLLAPAQVVSRFCARSSSTRPQIGGRSSARSSSRGTRRSRASRRLARVMDPTRRQGLIWHHQGTGKTLAMAFAAAAPLNSPGGPTVVIVLDRIDLVEQTVRAVHTAGLPRAPRRPGRATPCSACSPKISAASSSRRSSASRSRFPERPVEHHRARRRGPPHPGRAPRRRHAQRPAQRPVLRADGDADLGPDRNTFKLFGDPERPRLGPQPLLDRALDHRWLVGAHPRRDAPRRLPHQQGRARRGLRRHGR